MPRISAAEAADPDAAGAGSGADRDAARAEGGAAIACVGSALLPPKGGGAPLQRSTNEGPALTRRSTNEGPALTRPSTNKALTRQASNEAQH